MALVLVVVDWWTGGGSRRDGGDGGHCHCRPGVAVVVVVDGCR